MSSSGLANSIRFRPLIRSRLLSCRKLHSSSAKFNSTQSKTSAIIKREYVEDKHRLRNIGIIAHINAGKTTTTERFLYLAGTTSAIGDVDKGTTVTDYLVQERDRGITITSAAVTFNWLKHRLNLIDTPGHVDFTFEVERSLSVLDGAITLLDASAGVEAQTVTVWNQARRYKLSNIVFLNKCDKPQADYEMCLNDLKRDLETDLGLVQLPIKSDSGKLSVVDIINRKHLVWNDPEENFGTVFDVIQLTDSSHLKEPKKIEHKVEELREKLVNKLTDFDEDLASQVIDCEKISEVSAETIERALRRVVVKGQICPVLVGSSFKYIGVQPLLDAIVKYLPSPEERSEQIEASFTFGDKVSEAAKNSKLNSAYVFKIMHDKRLGPLCYLRVTSGTLEKSQRFKNLENSQPEQVKKVYRVFADELKEIGTPVTKDDIVVVTGLNHTRTGNLLIDAHYKEPDESADDYENIVESNGISPEERTKTEKSISKDSSKPFRLLEQSIIVPRIDCMEPVYYSSIESQSQSQQIKLEKALAMVSREDSSFSFDINALGVTTIRGMGKLHLEIIRDRLKTEHGVDALLGPIQISYRETIGSFAVEDLSVDRLVNSVKNVIKIKLGVYPKPGAGIWSAKKLRLDLAGESSSSSSASSSRLRNDHRRAIENGIRSALQHGPLLGHPVIDCEIVLLSFQANNRCGLPMISSASSQCLASALQRCSPLLMEPIMYLEVNVPQEHNGLVLSDLTSTRRAQIVSTLARGYNSSVVQLRSLAPLANLADYSEFLRIATSGRANFTMQLHSYRAMSDSDRLNLVRV